jgi:hypothetical protein
VRRVLHRRRDFSFPGQNRPGRPFRHTAPEHVIRESTEPMIHLNAQNPAGFGRNDLPCPSGTAAGGACVATARANAGSPNALDPSRGVHPWTLLASGAERRDLSLLNGLNTKEPTCGCTGRARAAIA